MRAVASDSRVPAARSIGHCQPVADETSDSYDDTEPINVQKSAPSHEVTSENDTTGLAPEEVNVAMHFLHSLHNATHWLEQHELEKKYFKLRLKSGQNSTTLCPQPSISYQFRPCLCKK